MSQTTATSPNRPRDTERSANESAPNAAPPPAPELAGGFLVGNVFGVDVRVDWSLLIIFTLITVNLGGSVLPSWHPDWGPGATWLTAVATAVLFFGSVLVHELSHALVARRRGIPVRRITLFLFGGMAHMEGEPPSPKAEFAMAIVGPITSVLIGVLATMAGVALAGDNLTLARVTQDPAALQAAMQSVGPVATLLLWLGPINLMLGIFNIIPGFPLDGGRVLRAALWQLTGDLTKATRWASGVGRYFALLLMAVGVLNVLSGALGQGLWLLLIGWFLNHAARASYEQVRLRQILDDVPVARVMRTQLVRVAPGLHLDEFVREHLMSTDQHSFPVEDQGRWMGVITLDEIRRVPQQQWADTTVADVMTPAHQVPTLPPQADAERALAKLARQDVEQLAIVDAGRVLGLVRHRDLMKWLAFRSSPND